jgi:uncharacterized protein (TIGR02996 family)
MIRPTAWGRVVRLGRGCAIGLVAVAVLGRVPDAPNLWRTNRAAVALARTIRPGAAAVACGLRWPSASNPTSDLADWASWRSVRGAQRPWLSATLYAAGGDRRQAHRAANGAEDELTRAAAAWLDADEGRYDESAAILRAFGDDGWSSVVHRAWVAFDQRDYREASQCFELADRLEPGRPDGPFGRGRIRQVERQDSAATADFTEAIRRCPTCAEAYLYRAFSRSAAGEPAVAVEADFAAAVTADPADVGARLHLADWLMNHGQLPAAREHYSAAARLKPEMIDPVLGLVDVACASGRRDEAERILRAAGPRFGAPDAVSRILEHVRRCG